MKFRLELLRRLRLMISILSYDSGQKQFVLFEAYLDIVPPDGQQQNSVTKIGFQP